jgi:hypothetical protein
MFLKASSTLLSSVSVENITELQRDILFLVKSVINFIYIKNNDNIYKLLIDLWKIRELLLVFF